MNKIIQSYHKNPVVYVLVVILFALMAVMSALSPGKFLTGNNFTSMGFQMVEFGILAIGMSVTIMAGGINLSLLSSAMCSAICGALVMQKLVALAMPDGTIILIGVVVTLLVSVICGAVNGFFIAYVGVLPILATLGSFTVMTGVALNISKGAAISGFPASFQSIGKATLFGVPYTVLFYILIIVIAYFLIQRTPWGISIYMVGGNEKATRFSGIDTKKTIMGVYIFSAVMSAIAGIIMTSRYNSAKSDYGSAYMMQAVAATVLGGTAITGGSGSVLGTVIAVMIMQVISSGLNIFGMNRSVIDILTGVILIGVLTFNFFMGQLSEKKKAAQTV